jgi:hypothetical protein
MRSMISFVAAVSFFSLTACAFDPQEESTASSDDALTAARPATDRFELPASKSALERSGEKMADEIPSTESVVARPSGEKNVFEMRPRCSEPRCDEAPSHPMPLYVRK